MAERTARRGLARAGTPHADSGVRFGAGANGLPSHGKVLLQVDRPDGESLRMQVNPGSPRWDTCLLDAVA